VGHLKQSHQKKKGLQIPYDPQTLAKAREKNSYASEHYDRAPRTAPKKIKFYIRNRLTISTKMEKTLSGQMSLIDKASFT